MRLIADQYERLDRFLARSLPTFSRTRLTRLIDAEAVVVDGESEKAAFRLEPGMEVELEPPGEREKHDLTPFPMPLDIKFEDAHLLVVNKPRGLATHPASTLSEPSLVNGLLAHGSELSSGSAPFRPGIVHRLDRDTTGLLVVAKTDAAHAALASQIADRTMRRGYLAIVAAPPTAESFDIDAPVGRDPTNRQRMAVVSGGRPALTRVHAVRQTTCGTLLAIRLATGRTHQIRVHLAAVGHPILGDRIYGSGEGTLQLHAAALAFRHPESGAELHIQARPPDDFLIGVEPDVIQRLLSDDWRGGR